MLDARPRAAVLHALHDAATPLVLAALSAVVLFWWQVRCAGADSCLARRARD